MGFCNKITLTLYLLAVSCANMISQDPNVMHFTTSEGLPSNQVYQVYQDSRNFIWFATDAGAARFDGTHFRYFTIKEGLNTNEIIKIQEDSKGRIWFFNFNGTFNFFDGKQILNETNAAFLMDLKSSFFFRQMYEDENNTLYFHFNLNRDIFALDAQNQVKKHKLPSGKIKRYDRSKLHESGYCMGMMRAGDAFLLFNSGGVFTTKDLSGTLRPIDTSLYLYRVYPIRGNIAFADGGDNKLKQHFIFKFENKKIIDSFYFPFRKPGEVINFIIEDVTGNYWISSHYSGVYCFKGAQLIRHFDIKKPQNILEDKEGNIWISSLNEGVYKYSRYILHQNHLPSHSFDGNGIVSISKRQDGGIWAVDGQRLYLIKDHKVLRSDIHFPGSGIDQVIELRNRTLILVESNLSTQAIQGVEIAKNQVTHKKVITDSDMVKFFAVNHAEDEVSAVSHNPRGINRFDQDELFSKKGKFRFIAERFYFIYYNARNQLFVNGSKVYLFDAGLLQPFEPLASFSGRIIRQHLNLTGDMELFNIGGDSLYLFDGEKLHDLSSAFSRSPEQQIKQMHYHHPYLFLAGHSRIFYCRNPENALKGKQLVLHTADLNFSNIHQILFDNNQLVVASDDGVSFLSLGSLMASKSNPPTPYFRSIQVNDTELTGTDQQKRFYGKSTVRFVMGNIHFGPGKALYAYMLEGEDKKWTAGSGSNIIYTSLSPGSYVFRFKVRTGESEWSDELVYEFRIKPFWWQHPLFNVFVAITGIFLTFLGLMRWKRNALRKQETTHQMLMLEQKALQSMMNPHFIFNTLGSIQNYLFKNNPADAAKYLVKFARLIRLNFNSTKTSQVSVVEEIERLGNYLELEQLRMNNRFSFSIEAEDVPVEKVMIPAMILQPIVENAVWHGISGLDSDGCINIRFTMMEKNIVKVIIEDNGIGITKASSRSNQKDFHLKTGMQLTRKRLEIMEKMMNIRTSMVTKEAFPGAENPGTRVEIMVPCSSFIMEADSR